MKQCWFLFVIAVASTTFSLETSFPPLVAAEQHEEQTKEWFTCGMHPEVVQDHPGNCPKCGMKLVPLAHDRARGLGLVSEDPSENESNANPVERKIEYWKSSMIAGEIHDAPGKDSMGMDLIPVYADEPSGKAPGSGSELRISPVISQNMGVRVLKVKQGGVQRLVRTVGFVQYNESTIARISTKVDGWVEKLYVTEEGKQVHRGDPLFEIYSPKLYSAQTEYLAARRNFGSGTAHGVIDDARNRLRLLDIADEEIDAIERAGRAKRTLTIRSAFTGVVTKKDVVQGDAIKAGMKLFEIADLSSVWVVGKVYEQDIPFIRSGQDALMTLSYLPGQTYVGKVTFVYPYMDEKTREMSIRMEFHNPGYRLKPGMYATVETTFEASDDSLLVPDVAVIDTGNRAVAFVRTAPGRFALRNVKVGLRSADNYLEVLSGLHAGDEVVTSGQFLLDSESRLREAAVKFSDPESGVPKAQTPSTAEHDHKTAAIRYACPMPEHVGVLYENPGKCPLCQMEMVPISIADGHAERAAIEAWTCPMPEHQHIREEGPGKCPICGMTLVPAETKQNTEAEGVRP